MIKNPTTRFSNHVNNYLKYRPHYPSQIIDFLKTSFNFDTQQVVADVGSGTGFLTKLFLENGNTTYGIEPNEAMRKAGEYYLKDYNNFISINGTAEATTLPNHSIDLITVAQAFHWFDMPKAKQEFLRILKPNHQYRSILLIWNQRKHQASAFMQAYLNFIEQFSTSSRKITESRINKTVLTAFFGTPNYKIATFPNHQYFDLEGLKGRYLSSSYAFTKTHPQHDNAMKSLTTIFNAYQKKGKVSMIYKTYIYYSKT